MLNVTSFLNKMFADLKLSKFKEKFSEIKESNKDKSNKENLKESLDNFFDFFDLIQTIEEDGSLDFSVSSSKIFFDCDFEESVEEEFLEIDDS